MCVYVCAHASDYIKKNGAHYQLFKSKHTQGKEATVFYIRLSAKEKLIYASEEIGKVKLNSHMCPPCWLKRHARCRI